jgi:hypothetical protein
VRVKTLIHVEQEVFIELRAEKGSGFVTRVLDDTGI